MESFFLFCFLFFCQNFLSAMFCLCSCLHRKWFDVFTLVHSVWIPSTLELWRLVCCSKMSLFYVSFLSHFHDPLLTYRRAPTMVGRKAVFKSSDCMFKLEVRCSWSCQKYHNHTFNKKRRRSCWTAVATSLICTMRSSPKRRCCLFPFIRWPLLH